MALRNCLLLTYHFPPSAASGTFRLLGLARHLPKFGWRPVVVAPPSLPWEPVDPALSVQVPADVVVHAAPYPGGLYGKLWRRLIGIETAWLPAAWRAARRAARQHPPEAILTSGPPHWAHLLGWWLKRRLGVNWVADLRDPWLPHGAVSPGWAKVNGCMRYWERAVVRSANVLVSNAPNACAALQEAYPEHRHKMVSVTNGFDREVFPSPLPQRGESGAPLRIVHTGELYASRDPRPFLDALCQLRDEAGACPFCAAFLGRANAGELDLGEEVRQRGLGGLVDLPGQVPYQQALAEMVAADVLLLLDGPGRLIGVPAKVYEYLGAGRPILALAEPDGDTAWALRQSGALHRLVPPRDRVSTALDVRTALLELAEEVSKGVPASAPARLHAFTREHMAERIALLLDGPRAVRGPSLAPVLAEARAARA
jgi:glycosyltransferase involved in cell wall biosynthesis